MIYSRRVFLNKTQLIKIEDSPMYVYFVVWNKTQDLTTMLCFGFCTHLFRSRYMLRSAPWPPLINHTTRATTIYKGNRDSRGEVCCSAILSFINKPTKSQQLPFHPPSYDAALSHPSPSFVFPTFSPVYAAFVFRSHVSQQSHKLPKEWEMSKRFTTLKTNSLCLDFPYLKLK